VGTRGRRFVPPGGRVTPIGWAIELTTDAYRKRYQLATDAADAARLRLEHRVYGTEVASLSKQELESVRFTAWAVESESIAPQADEAAFKGTLTGPVRRADFSLTVVKQSGKWRVNTLVVPGPNQ
jgi:hypothetical protein